MKYPTFFIFLLINVLTSFAQTTPTDRPADPPTDRSKFYLFLLAGQSNMAGRGDVAEQSDVPNPRILALNRNDEWVIAKDPLHWDKPSVAGVGPGISFANEMLKDLPDDVVIGLIPAACGGSPIRVWQKGEYWSQTDSYPYDDAVKRITVALRSGILKGILWHQGSSDSKIVAQYPFLLQQLADALRTEFNSPNIPFISGEIGRFRANREGINYAFHNAKYIIPVYDAVSSEGLTHIGDSAHFNTMSQHILGKRYAEKMKQLLAADVNRIVYPARACPAVVKAGNHITILYNNLLNCDIDSVFIESDYYRASLSVEAVKKGSFEYDAFTKAAVNTSIEVVIPPDVPEDLYDLKIRCGGEINISAKAVKILKEYRNPFVFIHISDPHISRQWVGTPDNGYAKELELLDRFTETANIINPEFIIVTGDIIHDYTRFDADSTGWGGNVRSGYYNRPLAEQKYNNYFYGSHGYKGIYAFNSPVFSIAGNHDFYGPDNDAYRFKAAQWNSLMGMRVYGFSYGNTRVLCSDDYLGDPVTDIPMSGLQGKVLTSYLSTAGHGALRIMAQHRHDRVDTAFMDANRISLVLNGHSHTPSESYLGSTPTLNIRPGTVCRSGEIAAWQKTLGFFRIFTVTDSAFSYSPPLRFCQNPTAAYNNIVNNLTVTFERNNNGSSISNAATLTNNLDVDLPACRIRFVMPYKKEGYKISDGEIFQSFNSPPNTIIDVTVSLKAHTSKTVEMN